MQTPIYREMLEKYYRRTYGDQRPTRILSIAVVALLTVYLGVWSWPLAAIWTIAYLAWFRALKLVPASTAATTVLVSPMIGVIGSTLLLGDVLGPRQIVALVMTLTGVALAARA